MELFKYIKIIWETVTYVMFLSFSCFEKWRLFHSCIVTHKTLLMYWGIATNSIIRGYCKVYFSLVIQFQNILPYFIISINKPIIIDSRQSKILGVYERLAFITPSRAHCIFNLSLQQLVRLVFLSFEMSKTQITSSDWRQLF